jgi:predicted PurR-regulated permease PerM
MLGFDIRTAKAAWTIFLVAGGLFLLYTVRETLLIVTYAIFLAYLIHPLVHLGEQHTAMPRSIVIALVFLLLAGAVLLFGFLLGGRIVEESIRLGQELPRLLTINNISDRIPLPSFLEPQRQKMVMFVTEQLQAGAGQATPFAKQIGVGVLHAASNLLYVVLVPIISFMLIIEAPAMRTNFLMMMERSQSKLWGKITADLNTLLAGYVRALLLLSLATFISYTTVLGLMGASYAALLGSIAAVLEFIPFLGPLAAIVIILVVLGFSGFGHLLWVVLFVAVYRGFQDYVLGPRIMSKGVEVPPLLVLIGLLAGDQIGGVPGIFLSVPVIAATRIIFMRLREAYSVKQAAPIPSPVQPHQIISAENEDDRHGSG